ncbi:MAG: hypothetical protein QOE61_3901, partial [Micromonosporaceae bacterium]|nr:hypothetical protein [Micromonosporaceae bacterium]
MNPSRSDSGKHDDGDPLRQLEHWGRQVDRRLRRARAGRLLLRRLAWPGRAIGRRPGTSVAVLLVIALGGALWLDRGSLLDWSGAGGSSPYPTATHPAGVFATSSVTADPAGPFAGTPSAHWAEGEAGISIPPATVVKGFTQAEVAAHLASVRMAMIAARLDHKMLVDHDPSAFLKLVAPGNRTLLSDQFRTGHLLTLVTLVDDSARLDSHPPRVSGRTSFASTRDESGLTVLEIVTNYVWAYGFDDDKVVLVHDEVRWQSYRVGDVRESDLGLWPHKYEGYVHNINCAAAD